MPGGFLLHVADNEDDYRENILAGYGKTPIHRHSRESGGPESLEKTGFPASTAGQALLSQE